MNGKTENTVITYKKTSNIIDDARTIINSARSFAVRSVDFCRLYQIPSALRTELNWSQYKLLIAISDPSKREYYELESANNGWTARETERQINSQLYERLLLSNDKERVLAVARKESIPENPTIGILLCTAKNEIHSK